MTEDLRLCVSFSWFFWMMKQCHKCIPWKPFIFGLNFPVGQFCAQILLPDMVAKVTISSFSFIFILLISNYGGLCRPFTHNAPQINVESFVPAGYYTIMAVSQEKQGIRCAGLI